jgi:hypothetical protein
MPRFQTEAPVAPNLTQDFEKFLEPEITGFITDELNIAGGSDVIDTREDTLDHDPEDDRVLRGLAIGVIRINRQK